VVYLPLEDVQYTRSRAATAVGPDAAIMLRHDWTTLSALPPDRWLGALFSFDLGDAVSSLVEMALAVGGFHDPRVATTGTMNAWGDHVGHTPALGAIDAPILARITPHYPTAEQIRDGEGTRMVGEFLDWAHAHHVRAIGGLPTGFADAPMPSATRAAIESVYRVHAAAFLVLPNRSEYPRDAFFDTDKHLNEPAQIVHSRAVAFALRGMLRDVAHNGGNGPGRCAGRFPPVQPWAPCAVLEWVPDAVRRSCATQSGF
jgi:hypothetical protein